VVQGQRGPLAITREAGAVALREEPLEATKRAGQRLALDQKQRLVGER
jgi:hypothetical protein